MWLNCSNLMIAAAAAKSLQSCPTLCDPRDSSPPGSDVPGILQARTREWVAIAFSSAWKWKVKVKSLSHVRLFATPWTVAYQVPLSMGFSRQEYWSGVPFTSPISWLNSDEWRVAFYGWARKCFLDIESSGEEAVMIVEILTKSLEYYKNLMIKQWQCLRGLTPIFEGSSVGKMLPVSIACYKKIIHERKGQSLCQASSLSHFKKLPQPPQPLVATSMISSSHWRWSKTLHQQNDWLAKGSDGG